MGGLPMSFYFERHPRRKIELLSMYTPPVEWHDDIEFEPVMLVDHETYKPKLLFPDVKPAKPHTSDPATFIEYQNGDGRRWRYRNMLLPMGDSLSTVTEERIDINPEGSTHGRVWFTGPIVFPALTEVIHGHEETWMSVTPMEIFTCRDGVRMAGARSVGKWSHRARSRDYPPLKKAVVAGLGLGWILHKLAAIKTVKEIVVVEYSKGLLDWYGAEMCAKVKKVTELIQGDYWEVADRYHDHFHVIDIWPHLGEAYNDDHLREGWFDEERLDWWAWGYQFGEDVDMDQVLDEDDAATRQLEGWDEDDED